MPAPLQGKAQPPVNHIRFYSVNPRPPSGGRAAAVWRAGAGGRLGLAASGVRRTERGGAGFGAGRVLRRSLIATAVAATAFATTLAPVTSRAQAPPQPQQIPNAGVLTPTSGMFAAAIADPNAALLQPSQLGNPAKPLRFRRPGDAAQDQAPTTGKFTAPSRIGATPVYGSPAGFGAGDTGFDSSNTPTSKKKALKAKAPPAPGPGVTVPETTFDPLSTTQFSAPAKPTTMQPLAAPAATQPPAPEVYPAKAAARPGAVLPPPLQPVPISNVPPVVYPLAAAHRAGGTVPVPLPIDTDAAGAIPKPFRTAAVRRISWWRRNCWCNPTGRGPRSPPASPARTPTTPMAASRHRSIA